MTVVSARDVEKHIHADLYRERNMTSADEELRIALNGNVEEYVRGPKLPLGHMPTLTRSLSQKQNNCPSRIEEGTIAADKIDGDLLRNKLALFSCDDGCKTPMPCNFHSVTGKDGDDVYQSKVTTSVDKMDSTPSLTILQTDEEKIRERSRKGRERSLRTRRRNIARLKLLEENCVHLSRENKILRELAHSLGQQDDERVANLVDEFRLAMEDKPEPYKLTQSESYYLNLLSPLSVTASTSTEETYSKELNVMESLMSLEKALSPYSFKGQQDKCNQKKPFMQQRTMTSSMRACSQVNLNASKSAEHVKSSAVVCESVFANPSYEEVKNFEFSLDDLKDQPLLSPEEIVDLIGDGARAAQLPLL